MQVFLTDAPAENLDSFVLSISEITLVAEDGSESLLFSGGEIREDLLELQMVQKFLASDTLLPGTYDGLRMLVTDISATAGGVPQSVSLAGGASLPVSFDMVFEDPVTLLRGSQAMITLDFDVDDSVTDGGGDSIVVESVIFVDVRTKHVDLEDFEGTVQSVDRENGTFEVMVIESSGPGSAEPVGFLTVQLVSTSLFEGTDDAILEGLEGLSRIVVGQSVEVEGTFDGSVVVADSVEAEESVNGPSDLEFEGLVLSTSPGNTALVEILEVKKDLGGDLAGLSLALVDMSGPVLYKAVLGSAPDVTDVVVGEKIEVQGTFGAGAVTANVVALEKTRFRGSVVSASNGSVTVNSLRVENRTIPGLTQETFEVRAITVVSVDDLLAASASELLPGQAVKVKAARDVSSDNWVAVEIEREASDFDGRATDVSAISVDSFSMTSDGTDLGLANPVTLTVRVQPETRILLVQQNAETMLRLAELPALLSSVAPSARVKVEGVLGGSSELLATEILIIP
ncbi:MAG: DUF5666 domain-containing protein [Planctomycetota bacterium]|nr:DUF5666 domain-containing protein [Planctomycetota bacterium]